jgi:hypothetical protein
MGVIAENSEINRALLRRLFDSNQRIGLPLLHPEQPRDSSTANNGGLLLLQGASVREINWPSGSDADDSHHHHHHPIGLQIARSGSEADDKDIINIEANLVVSVIRPIPSKYTRTRTRIDWGRWRTIVCTAIAKA